MRQGQELIRDIDERRLGADEFALWWLGQHSFIAKFGETVLYLDLYLAPSKARQVPPLLSPEDVSHAAAFLGTHDHGDHIDRKTWPALAAAAPGAKFVVPDLVRPNLIEDLPIAADRYIGLDDGQSTMIGGVKITAIPAAHELLDRDEATGRYPYLGYILEYNGMALYHSGDTCIYEGMQDKLRQWTLDAALLPINGRDAERFKRNCIGNMTYQEAVDLAGAIRPRLTIPTHFDMFANNSENPQLFLDYIAAKYPKIKARMANYGECLIVKKAGE